MICTDELVVKEAYNEGPTLKRAHVHKVVQVQLINVQATLQSS